MSAICQRFVQNTWRSDLCSNCFKSLEDHSGGHSDRSHLTSSQRYVPQATILYQTRGLSSKSQWRTSLGQCDRVASRDFASQTELKRNQEAKKTGSSQKGILKEVERHKGTSRRSNVGFATEEAMVIGYGGNDYDSDDSFELGSDDGSIDLELLDLTEEDRKVTRMTKNNTEFNSFNKNLLSSKNTDTNNNTNRKSNQRTVSNSNPSNDKNTEKKAISQYYFSMKDDPLNSHVYKERDHLSSSREATKHCDAVSPLRPNEVILSLNMQNQAQHRENSKILLNEDYTPLNTTTYSFVSKIDQKSNSVDQGSDSDYSTSRLTNGESTDSESFPDSDGVPCQSFLHGTRADTQTVVKDCKEEFNPFDAGSSTSGDISNFSDDSDSHTPPEINYETANIKISPSIKTSGNKDSMKTSSVKSELNNSRSPPKDRQHIISHNDKNFKSSHVEVVQLNCTSTEGNRCDAYKTGENKKDVKHKKNVCESKSIKENCQKKESEISLISNVMEARKKDSVHSSTVIVSKKDNTAAIVPTEAVTPENKSRRNSEDNKRTPSSNCDNNDIKKDIVKEDKKGINGDVGCVQNVTINGMEPHDEFDESPDFKDMSSDAFKTADDKNDRQLKLAALALELERARCDTVLNPDPIISHLHPVKCPPTKVVTPKTPQDTSYSTIRRTSGIPSSAKLVEPSPLPDVLQDMKPKKNRFSLKKLLKRNSKDYESPPGLAANPKAWKKHSFDRSRLSLDIIHPMELVSSSETTPTDEQKSMGIFADPKGRARSLSALPHLSNHEENHARKAGTVAERKKKSRPQLVRTPSCSALHSRPTAPNVPTPPRPPKPPPPPRSNNSQPPPPPPPQSRIAKLANSPARPPPPRAPDGKARVSPQNSSNLSPTSLEIHSQCNPAVKGEYANLGYIRSLLTPKKPERPSAPSGLRGGEMGHDDPYQTLEVGGQDEEDHYTYLDDAELKSSIPEEEPCTNEVTIDSLPEMTSFTGQPPWTNLQTSYSAIAAAIYESLNDLTTTALQEDIECFQKLTPSLKWRDFYLESEKPEKIIEDKVIFNALHKNLPQIKVTLMVTTQKQNTQSTRNLSRLPMLASFNDTLPSHLLQTRKTLDSTNAFIYVLQRSRVTTIERFSADDNRSQVHQHIKLRDDCFVLLQLIHTLKSLQAEGIEELSSEVSKVLLVQTDHEKPPMLILLPGDKLHLLSSINGHNVLTLCQTTLHMLLRLLQVSNVRDIGGCLVNGETLAEPVSHTFSAIARVLAEEKASSLTQAKGLLEHMLWGPVDVQMGTEGGTEEVLQRWLDLQRAQMVKSLVANSKSAQSRLHVYEEYQLVYLLQASVKSLKDVLSKL